LTSTNDLEYSFFQRILDTTEGALPDLAFQVYMQAIQGLGDNAATLRTSWFEKVTSGTSGSFTAPTGGTIVLDGWPEGVDVLVSKMDSLEGAPSFESVTTAAGAVVTATLDASGNYTLSGTPSAYPIALIYVYSIPTASIDSTKSLTYLEVEDGILTNYKEGLYTTTTTGDITIDLANGNVQRITLDAIRQITMPADPGAYGQSFVLILECATFTPTWGATPVIEWLTSDGAAPTLVTTANLVNVVTFVWDDTDSRWLGFLGGSETA